MMSRSEMFWLSSQELKTLICFQLFKTDICLFSAVLRQASVLFNL
jgi:hypothetical protein